MEQLKNELKIMIAQLPPAQQEAINEARNKLNTLYPYNEYTNSFYVLANMDQLSLEKYNKIRDDYFKRNPFLQAFEMGPRSFGERWGEDWLKTINRTLMDPPHTEGNGNEFDLWLPISHCDKKGIKIEVKASRVVDDDAEKTFVARAFKKPKGKYAFKKIKRLPFTMNFQQLKPSCCDVFIWLAVWLDKVDIWVIPATKVIMRLNTTPKLKKNDSIVRDNGTIYMSSQHRGGRGSNISEGQVFITHNHYSDLDCYKATSSNLIHLIKQYGKTK